MSYRVGDYVRIRAPHELRGHRIQGGSAIEKWQNRTCMIEEVRPSISGKKYKLSLLEILSPDDISCNGIRFSEYRWEEFELDLIEMNDIQESTYEELIGGVC